MMVSLSTLAFKEAFSLLQDLNALVAAFQSRGLLHSTMACKSCSAGMKIEKYTKSSDRLCWRCLELSCQKRVSIHIGSYFEKHKLSLAKIFMILFCSLKYNKMLLKDMADITDVHENMLVDWGNYVRESISSYFLKHPLILGTREPVQIDESMFGGRCKYHKGNHGQHKKSWVFGIIEEKSNLNVMWMVDNQTKETLVPLINAHIAPGATIKSDLWSSYCGLKESGFKHLTVNHSVEFVSSSGIHMQLIENLWSQVKSLLKAKRGTQYQLLQGYLDYYSFKCLAKNENRTMFDRFLDIIQVGAFY
jgi:transposase-like protein